MENIEELKKLLKNHAGVLDIFEGLLTASVLLDYKINLKKIEHNNQIYFAVTFNLKEKEIHLDFSFSNKNELINICTCRGDCNAVEYGDSYEKFIKTIDCFKNILLS
jgi:hypothetical protein